ncbi:class I SAM-dependent methyltransferase [Metabacillus indicus]|uniref:class I SAM-dependent methyltransferase n=1 Tax=Metabacillus indicus TaxID=246786 RepID=UPI003CF6CB0D
MKFEEYMKEAERPFTGWDFSFITETGRMQSGLLSWSYGSMAHAIISDSASMLDMGTGGGEFLAKLQPFPASVTATEGYEPNVSIAKSKLESLGVTVVPIDNDAELPFPDGTFDLILNQHESFDPEEVSRILKEGGLFLTQQVGGLDCLGINEALGEKPNEEYLQWNLSNAVYGLKEAGFDVLFAKEEYPPQRFYDIGALIYYLKAIPWQVPDFIPDLFKERLLAIHNDMAEKGFFEVKQHRFVVKAEK